MWDTIVQFLKSPDSWTLIFGFFGTFSAAAATYFIKKFKLNWRPVISFKPTIGPSEIAKLIEEKLKEVPYLKNYETLQVDHFQLLSLFKVSESQWEEKIMEQQAEITKLKAEKQALLQQQYQYQQQQTTSERHEG